MIGVEALCKTFASAGERVKVLDEVSFDAKPGQLFTLLGPSGCGKSTTLRSIAGLEQPDTGTITIGGRAVFNGSGKVNVATDKRSIGMVFQSYAIWPHMTVGDNVAYPLRAKRTPRGEIRRRVVGALELVGLEKYLDRPAPLLSGGQQQRVALARAIVAEPAVLLLDEPLSNLDAKLRENLRQEIRTLQQRVGLTAAYVTHDQQEALAISDTIAVMLDGRVLEVGEPYELYQRPKYQFTANFLGTANLLKGRLVDKPSSRDGIAVVDTSVGRLLCTLSGDDGELGQEVTLFFRPENADLLRTDEVTENGIPVRVLSTTFLGNIYMCRLAAGDEQFVVQVHRSLSATAGEQLTLRLDPAVVRIVADNPAN